MRELKLIPNGEISDEAKVKLDRLRLRKEMSLKKLQDDYDSGKFDEYFKKPS
jgi:hypothetical protein